jgi:hypothetical protein
MIANDECYWPVFQDPTKICPTYKDKAIRLHQPARALFRSVTQEIGTWKAEATVIRPPCIREDLHWGLHPLDLQGRLQVKVGESLKFGHAQLAIHASSFSTLSKSYNFLQIK